MPSRFAFRQSAVTFQHRVDNFAFKRPGAYDPYDCPALLLGRALIAHGELYVLAAGCRAEVCLCADFTFHMNYMSFCYGLASMVVRSKLQGWERACLYQARIHIFLYSTFHTHERHSLLTRHVPWLLLGRSLEKNGWALGGGLQCHTEHGRLRGSSSSSLEGRRSGAGVAAERGLRSSVQADGKAEGLCAALSGATRRLASVGVMAMCQARSVVEVLVQILNC